MKVIVVSLFALLVIGVGVSFFRTNDAAPLKPQAALPARNTFEPTIQNKIDFLPSPPADMAWIPGGEFSMGANDPPDLDDVVKDAPEPVDTVN